MNLQSLSIFSSRDIFIVVSKSSTKDKEEVCTSTLQRVFRRFFYRFWQKLCRETSEIMCGLLGLLTFEADRRAVNNTINSKHTSSEANVSRGPDKIIRDIDNRIAEWTLLPLDHGGSLQVIRYQVGQKCDGHYDHLNHNRSSSMKGGERMATVLMYLSDVEKGGETVFPKAKGISVKPNRKAKGISVKPKMGDALLFWNMKPDGSLDPLSFHAASRVIKGNKWCCRKWFHVNKCHV